MTTYSKYRAGATPEKTEQTAGKKVSVFEIQCIIAGVAVLALFAVKSLSADTYAQIGEKLDTAMNRTVSSGIVADISGKYAQYLLSQYAQSGQTASSQDTSSVQNAPDDAQSMLGLAVTEPVGTVMKEYKQTQAENVNVGGDLVPVALITNTTLEKTDSFAQKAKGGLLSAPSGCSFEAYFPDVSLSAPISGKITSDFGYRYHPITGLFGFHTGVDIAAAKGTVIRAAAAGKVSERGYSDVWGNYIIIDHDNSTQTFYAHCSALYKKKGTSVKSGEKIAAVGSTGYSTGPHLHFEVRIDGINMDPSWIL